MNPSIEDYRKLQPDYLAKAEEMFGPKTEYNFMGVFYHALGPRTVFFERDQKGAMYFIVQLCRQGAENLTDGIFQLSHEVVHLLSPVAIDKEEDQVNYLEEGMAVYFSKVITESETGDVDFCDAAIAKQTQYFKAYELYSGLIHIDNNAVIKLRRITPVIANIQPEDFAAANLNIPEQLINGLLTKFKKAV
jgi:hypothetical protein